MMKRVFETRIENRWQGQREAECFRKKTRIQLVDDIRRLQFDPSIWLDKTACL
jgi:hypothetical protein